jgi:hypothetical protein
MNNQPRPKPPGSIEHQLQIARQRCTTSTNCTSPPIWTMRDLRAPIHLTRSARLMSRLIRVEAASSRSRMMLTKSSPFVKVIKQPLRLTPCSIVEAEVAINQRPRCRICCRNQTSQLTTYHNRSWRRCSNSNGKAIWLIRLVQESCRWMGQSRTSKTLKMSFRS